ncbi:MAG TPA: TIGR03032 family protein [Xanthomonadales bacterium]|nr:TIGR03032 family protein [Xanthomonadales bacterium]
MRLPRPFIRLPLRFDVDRLRAEVAAFAPSDWRPHPQGHPGNSALPLVAVGGNPADDGVAGAMAPTPHLARSPYLRQVMGALGAPLGRSRLMKLDARAEATPHVDTNYYWLDRVRVHVPVVTRPEVEFQCGDASVHMPAGECWIFDTWRRHNVLNHAPVERIHLVVDTIGSPAFAALVARDGEPQQLVSFVPDADPALAYEQENFPLVMAPSEVRRLWERWVGDLQRPADDAALAGIAGEFAAFEQRWSTLWREHGTSSSAHPAYAEAAAQLAQRVAPYDGRVPLVNGIDLSRLLRNTLVPALHTPNLATTRAHVPDLGQVAAPPAARRFDRPIVIVAAPRSGSTLLFETLARCTDAFTVGNESHREFESIAALAPAARDWSSNALAADDATADTVAALHANFEAALRDRAGNAPPATGALRLLEKTPKNSLRIPFLERAFPGALYVHLHRAVEPNVSSLLDGWRSGRFATYPQLPGWSGMPWSFVLVPGWRELAGRPAAAIASAQWRAVQEAILADLGAVDPARRISVTYEALCADPHATIARICAFAGLQLDASAVELKLSRHTLTPPSPDKWRRNETELAPGLEALRALDARVRDTFGLRDGAAAAPAPRNPVMPPSNNAPAPAANDTFASAFTNNLPLILRQLRTSLAISTYQAGRLIIARDDGRGINTHFLVFQKPMGMAADGSRLLLGTQNAIQEFRNVPAVSARLEPPNRHDAVYVLRNTHVTGNIDIHEMGIGARGECWYVNTLFSCLCTLDREYSFEPRWRPRFVSALAPEDRCHLNGLAMVDGRPRWLTALGETDTHQGWRANKKDGGIMLDFDSGEIVARGLSMPHSPRWYRGRLWFLESGRGSLATLDPRTGRVETVARVPGFTRGLDFVDRVAFIGLSQLRETNAFTDIPVTDEHEERACGVWAVDIETGTTIAFLRFSGSVQEIFAVQALPGVAFPEVLDAGDLLDTTYTLPDAALREVSFGK